MEIELLSVKKKKKKKRSISGEGLFFSLIMAQHIERNQEATIYIGNLDERCTDSLVWELMLQAGPVGMFSFCFILMFLKD